MFLVCCLFALSLYGQDTANINKTDASGAGSRTMCPMALFVITIPMAN